VTYWHELWAGSLGGVLQGFGLSLVSIIGRNIGMNATQMAIMLSMPFAGHLMSLGLGHLVRGRSARAWVFWPGLVSRVVLLLVAFVRTPGAFMAVFCVHYVVSTIPGPAYASIMKTNYSDPYRGVLMSRIRIRYTAIVAAGAAIAGVVLETHPLAYRWVVPLAAAFGVAGTFVFHNLKVRRCETQAGGQRGLGESLRAVTADRTFLYLMVIFFVCAGAPKMAIPLEPIRLVDELHMDYGQAGWIMGTVTALTSMLGYWLWGRLSARARPLNLLMAVFVLSALRHPILALARSPWHVLPASAITGLSNSGYDLVPLFAMIGLAGPGQLPVYIAFHNSLVGVRGLVGPYLGTALHDGVGLSVTSVYWIITGVAVAGVALMAIFIGSRAGNLRRS
jgi:predicted MFS family arabinose efflux permease